MESFDFKSVDTNRLRELHKQIRDEIYDREHAERIEANRNRSGQCYRYRNSYGHDSKGWWLYQMITGSDPDGELQGITFQDDGEGKLTWEIGRLSESTLGDPITAEEWERELVRFEKKIEAGSR